MFVIIDDRFHLPLSCPVCCILCAVFWAVGRLVNRSVTRPIDVVALIIILDTN